MDFKFTAMGPLQRIRHYLAPLPCEPLYVDDYHFALYREKSGNRTELLIFSDEQNDRIDELKRDHLGDLDARSYLE